jgi:citronellyl-CoA dehydrogenase
MELTQEHREVRRTLRRFIDNEINPHVDEWEKAETFPAHALFKKMGDLGLLGLTKPTEYGGMGLDYTYSVVMAETLGHIACGGIPMAIGVQTDMATPALARFGSDEVRKTFLAPSISGDYVACLGVSETGAGSDVASIKTTARKDGDDYVINGGKMWTTNGTQADWMCLLANTSEGAAHKNKTLICLPLRENGPSSPLRKGIEITRKIRKIGMMSSDTAQFYFDEVRVPQRWRIGEEGMGFTYQMMQFQEERLWAAASAIESLSRNIRDTVDYIRERQIFGQSVLDHQVVHYRLAELKTEVECLRALTYRAVDLYTQDKDVTDLASMAKLKAGRLSREVPDACLQFWGGMGFTWDNPVSRAYRDGRLASIGGGADEVMLGIISKLMGIAPAKSGKPKA